MTTDLAVIDHSNGPLVDKALARLKHLLRSPDDAPKAALEAAVGCLSTPARPEWVMARTAALLSPYYEKDVPQGIREMEAEDWADALTGYPQWAIQKAAQWWKSADNPDRRKRPLEGDIAARARIEMGAVRAAQIKMRLTRACTQAEDHSRKRATNAQVHHIIEELGLSKRMGAQ